MRWISLGLSVFAFGFACFSNWFAFKVNGKLVRNNQDLREENIRLHRVNKEYEAEILRLRGLLKGEEASDEG
jgi:hypothetical protein